MRLVLSTLFVLFVGIGTASAKTHHHYRHHHYARHHYVHHHYTHRRHYDGSSSYHVAGDPRPAAWCGYFMRHLMGVVDRAYNLAANWAHYGKATTPHVGAIVVWHHHVGKIVGGEPGKWAVLSGNDGHRVRTRVRSLAGAIAFRD